GPLVERLPGFAKATSTIRREGAPQREQQPPPLLPARMQGSTRRSGNVAKWARLYGWVAIVQTDRRLRPEGSPTERLRPIVVTALAFESRSTSSLCLPPMRGSCSRILR